MIIFKGVESTLDKNLTSTIAKNNNNNNKKLKKIRIET